MKKKRFFFDRSKLRPVHIFRDFYFLFYKWRSFRPYFIEFLIGCRFARHLFHCWALSLRAFNWSPDRRDFRRHFSGDSGHFGSRKHFFDFDFFFRFRFCGFLYFYKRVSKKKLSIFRGLDRHFSPYPFLRTNAHALRRTKIYTLAPLKFAHLPAESDFPHCGAQTVTHLPH